MIGIQNTEALHNSHKVTWATCGFRVCPSCTFTPKLLLFDGVITILPSVSVRAED